MVTVDYVPIKCDHPNITTLTTKEVTAQYLAGTLEPFDAFASFSSLEHSGLGRYGDDLLPYADLISIAKVRNGGRVAGQALYR